MEPGQEQWLLGDTGTVRGPGVLCACQQHLLMLSHPALLKRSRPLHSSLFVVGAFPLFSVCPFCGLQKKPSLTIEVICVKFFRM